MQTLNLKEAKSIIRSKFFPFFGGICTEFKYKILIGLGGNIGDTRVIFERFFMKLKKDRRFFIKESSPLLLNKAFGYESRDYLNAVILLYSSKSAVNILKIMQHYEMIFKRQRTFKNAPRTLDLDLLYFSKKVFKTPSLTVPHIGARERVSVVVPLGLMKGI